MLGGIVMMLIWCIVTEEVASELTGDHVCLQEYKYKENVTRIILKNVTVRTYDWCMQIPPRCSVYKLRQINETKIEEEDKIDYVKHCCNGYYEVDAMCLPNSCRSCEHGECEEDGLCRCADGYWGDNCDRECVNTDPILASGGVTNDCIGSPCNFRHSNCTCRPKSIRCDLICSQGRPSNCYEHCKCDNDRATATCDPLTGQCETANGDYVNAYVSDLFPERRKYHHNFDVTTARSEAETASVTTPSEEKAKMLETNDLTTIFAEEYRDIKVTTITPINNERISEKDQRYTTETYTESTTNPDNQNISSYLISPDEITANYHKENSRSEPNSEKRLAENSSVVNNQNGITALPSLNETSHKLIIDSHLFITIISGALFSVLIIMSAAVFCVLYKLKEKRKKYVNANGQDENAKIKDSISAVSVTTRSIFHTPLPDPPVFENPVFLTQFEAAPNKQPGGTFETHVICNMNIPKLTTSYNQIKSADNPELFYDHPPSTGSYRAVPVPEPPRSPISDCTKTKVFDPIYDEIPCNQRIIPAPTPPPSYISEQSTLYMNTK